MSAFKTRRAKLLPIIVLLSILLVWQPWVGIEPAFRGVKMDSDFAGGTQMVFELQASRVTVQITSENLENVTDEIASALETSLGTSTRLVSYETANRQGTFEVYGYLTEPVVQKALEGLGEVVSITPYLEDNELAQVVLSLRSRIDPYDVMGVKIRPLGQNLMVFEAANVDLTRAIDLLSRQGKLEIIVDNQVIIGNEAIQSISDAVSLTNVAYAPLILTENATETLRQAVSGKVNHALVVYMDRPANAILVFDNRIMNGSEEIAYDESTESFFVTYEATFESSVFHISVSAVPSIEGQFSPASSAFLANQKSEKTRVILLGSLEDFSQDVIGEILINYEIVTVPRRDGETTIDWIFRACGVQSAPTISQTMSAGAVTSDLLFPLIGRTSSLSLQKAQNFQKALLYNLNCPISLESETSIEPSFGASFKSQALIAIGLAFLWSFFLLFAAFSRIKVALSILVFVVVDAALTILGISIFSLSFGLAAIAGLLFVVLSGLSQHIIITNEMLKGVQPQEKATVGWRTSRALKISYLATFAAIVVSALTAFLGFGPIRTFAIVAAVGSVIAMLLTRPVFARIMESVLSGKPKMSAPAPALKQEYKPPSVPPIMPKPEPKQQQIAVPVAKPEPKPQPAPTPVPELKPEEKQQPTTESGTKPEQEQQ